MSDKNVCPPPWKTFRVAAEVRRRPKVVVRLGLVAMVPLVCLAALGAQPLLDAREALDHSAALPSLIEPTSPSKT